MRHPLVRMAFCLALFCTGAAMSAPSPQPEISVDGTSFVLQLADGRSLRSPQMVGATVFLALDGQTVASVRIASVVPDPKDPEILRHEFEVEAEPGHWKPACGPTKDGQTWGFPLALPEGHPGRLGAITMACASGGVGKCVRFGYAPWRAGPNGENLAPYHAACLHLLRADYGGDDRPHTRNGTPVDLWDRLGMQGDDNEPKPGFRFEAGWGPNGAVCVARTRWSDLVTLDELRRQYPHRFDRICDSVEAQAQGALLFNHSMEHEAAQP